MVVATPKAIAQRLLFERAMEHIETLPFAPRRRCGSYFFPPASLMAIPSGLWLEASSRLPHPPTS